MVMMTYDGDPRIWSGRRGGNPNAKNREGKS